MVRDDYQQQHPEKAAQLEKFIKIYQTSDKVKQTLNSEIGEKTLVPWLEVSISNDAIFHSKSKKMADWLKHHRGNFSQRVTAIAKAMRKMMS